MSILGILGNIFGRLVGSRNTRLLKQLRRTVDGINRLESEWQALSDNDLRGKTHQLRERLAQNTPVEALIPEAFATVREVSRRVLAMRHFDVQLIGGMVLHQGKTAEMRTGEGKTLVATLAYLDALFGRGVHVVTVNDYLAKRDAKWMKPVYQFLGLKVGVIQAGLTPIERQRAYAADITYGTNNEFGFDYLRDNMALSVSDQVQRGLHYAIVDEVDSILIDEARTPLIISDPSEESSEYYSLVDQVIPNLKSGESEDFVIDEKKREVYLTDRGHQKLEEQFVRVGLLTGEENAYSAKHINLMYHISAALRAHYIFKRDVDYIVQADQIVIVDEHTGRLMPGRRWSDGLHQAVEAKEKVTIQPENKTLASITFQNYFRLYSKLAGMTGTAATEASELQQIYGLEVVVIPTNRPVQGEDLPDKIYLTQAEKWSAIITAIENCWKRQRPVLVGTVSIENSERLSRRLQQRGIPHQVLNAKRHEKEALIIAEAGRPGAVTIATNMAGRGTDIILGGNLQAELAAFGTDVDDTKVKKCRAQWKARYEAVLAVGGLHVIGSERHESRRIDNQFGGRTRRQGDPGSVQFYLSLEDDLLRVFAADRLGSLMKWLGMQTGESIEHSWVTRAIQNAQRKVEAQHFDMRKQRLEYDDIMNEQRKIIYQRRQEILMTDTISDVLQPLWEDVLQTVVAHYVSEDILKEDWNIEGLDKQLKADFALSLPLSDWLQDEDDEKAFADRVVGAALQANRIKQDKLGVDKIRYEKIILLQTMDHLWREHLSVMEHLYRGIHLRGFAHQNPKQEYKREAFMLFEQLLEMLKYQVISTISRLDITELSKMTRSSEELKLESGYQMIGRNQACPCGSGKKFKYCHGRLS